MAFPRRGFWAEALSGPRRGCIISIGIYGARIYLAGEFIATRRSAIEVNRDTIIARDLPRFLLLPFISRLRERR